MSPQDAIELLYAVLRSDRAYQQMNGHSFLLPEEHRKLFEVVVAIESRYNTVPRIYRGPYTEARGPRTEDR